MEQDQLEEALKVAEHAVQMHPQDDTLHRNHGVLLYRLDQHEEALAAFDNALELNSHVVDTWVNKGTVLKAQADLSGALEAFDKALEINPNFTVAKDGRIGVLSDIEAAKPKGFISRIFGG